MAKNRSNNYLSEYNELHDGDVNSVEVYWYCPTCGHEQIAVRYYGDVRRYLCKNCARSHDKETVER